MLKRLIILFFIGIFFSISVLAKKHNITVVGITFSPASLTIEIGDTVIWTNNTGVGHNVNGTQVSYPNNPESFGNLVGPNWTYEFGFSQVGIYEFHCNPHVSRGMKGLVIVEAPTGLVNSLSDIPFDIYPNPAMGIVQVDWEFSKAADVFVFDLNGKSVLGLSSVKQGLNRLNISALSPGIYFIVLYGEEVYFRKKLIKN
jgi:plastocyanin